ncbi:acyltransferase family protein [Serratia quinivorans]|uniref:acyltransferase family protein n=1 Tax=Serratia quinivorans TaxID=137545 RepID=UPI002179BE96|nr:acyltransferase [Serratia quinivorans]CAI0925505.1 Predicted membrane protein [Serratia quinivorans]
MKNNRVESLDYLRGLMALSVVIYHYTSWSLSSGSSVDVIGSQYLLGKLGIYAVSVFYILSGISLAYIYDGKITSTRHVAAFAVKRVFRIFPLFWIAVTGMIIFSWLLATVNGQDFDFPYYKAFLNYTLLFGFIDPTAYLSTGAWSIGNELVFYSILCLTYFISSSYKLIFPTVVILSIATGVYFSIYGMNSSLPLSEQWPTYINPFNQLFLFMCGAAIGKYAPKLNVSKSTLLLIIFLSALSFILYPVHGDKINLVSGVNRILISVLCILFSFSLYKINPSYDNFLTNALGKLGEISYSIYLMHPIVAIPVIFLAKKIGIPISYGYIASFICVIFIGFITYYLIEKPMMRVGANIALWLKKEEMSVQNLVK